MPEPIVHMTRKVGFSAGHRYWIGSLSEAENRALFGRWASPFNHGHNYGLAVTVAGRVDPLSGMIVNIKDIDEVLQRHIVARFDQKSLNDETPEFSQNPPSVENILLQIWHLLDCRLPAEVHLFALRLEETPLLYGEMDIAHPPTLTRIYEFAASHRLHVADLSEEENLRLFGKCNNAAGHGHNYVLEVTVEGKLDPRTGMSVDLESLDATVEGEVLQRYDHKNLNVDVPEFQSKTTTSEVVALEIFNRLQAKVPGVLKRIRLHETARNAFEVSAP